MGIVGVAHLLVVWRLLLEFRIGTGLVYALEVAPVVAFEVELQEQLFASVWPFAWHCLGCPKFSLVSKKSLATIHT